MNTKLTGFAKSYAENRQTFINTLSDIIGVKPDIFAEVLKSKTKNMYPNDYVAISEVALNIIKSDCVDFINLSSEHKEEPKSEYYKARDHYIASINAWLEKINQQHGNNFFRSNLINLIKFFNKKYQKKYGEFDFCKEVLNLIRKDNT